ncbi:hypothetical protein B0O99DRAFT_639867 [Bisporella sp. PMI_857]|nr:hypothetical protein B0O99DRAFT_639867 [Bisporella sp. PMI_857]
MQYNHKFARFLILQNTLFSGGGETFCDTYHFCERFVFQIRTFHLLFCQGYLNVVVTFPIAVRLSSTLFHLEFIAIFLIITDILSYAELHTRMLT